MIVSLIVAVDERGGIGKHNQLPWHLPSDLKRFKKLTTGHSIVMGRKTYETIGKPLPGRTMIVVSHKKEVSLIGCLTVNSLQAAIKLAQANFEDELFIIGGGEIFRQAIDSADRIYLTTVHTDADADVFFPKFDLGQWELISEENGISDDADEFPSDFKILFRKH